MDAYVEAVDFDIVIKFKKFLVEEGENEIIVSLNFIHRFSDTIDEVHGLNRGKAVIDLRTGDVPALPATGNDILLDSYILIESDGKIRMQYFVSDPDPDFGDGT